MDLSAEMETTAMAILAFLFILCIRSRIGHWMYTQSLLSLRKISTVGTYISIGCVLKTYMNRLWLTSSRITCMHDMWPAYSYTFWGYTRACHYHFIWWLVVEYICMYMIRHQCVSPKKTGAYLSHTVNSMAVDRLTAQETRTSEAILLA